MEWMTSMLIGSLRSLKKGSGRYVIMAALTV